MTSPAHRRTLRSPSHAGAFLLPALAAILLVPATAPAQDLPPGVELDALARTIVEENARVQDGELVWIQGGTEVLELMERVAIAVARVGGQPLVTVFSNDMLRRWYREVPEHFDDRREEWLWRLPEPADVHISFDTFDPVVFGEVDPARLSAWDEANHGYRDRNMADNGVRVVWVGNDLFPAPGRARGFGAAPEELARVFWGGVVASPKELAARGRALREVLEGASTIRVTSPNGTDLTLRPGSGSVVVTDGTTFLPGEADDLRGALNMTWLPGGEVTLGLEPEATEGRLVVEATWFDGLRIDDLSVLWEGGRLVALDSPSDVSRIASLLASDPPRSQAPTGFKIGLNPRVAHPRIPALMAEGTVSVSLGGNRFLGGEVDLPFLLFLSLRDATVEVDGHRVVEEGRLRLR
jgi:aminopeptidase